MMSTKSKKPAHARATDTVASRPIIRPYLDNQIRDAAIAWETVKAAQLIADRAIQTHTLTSEMASTLAKAARDYVAKLNKLVSY
jgi:hypothetical protein